MEVSGVLEEGKGGHGEVVEIHEEVLEVHEEVVKVFGSFRGACGDRKSRKGLRSLDKVFKVLVLLPTSNILKLVQWYLSVKHHHCCYGYQHCNKL